MWWDKHVPVPSASADAYEPLMSGGAILGALGASGLMAGGLAWVIAASSFATLDDECPGKICVEGTRGGRAYKTARDGERAAGILAAIGLPMIAASAVMFTIALSTDKPRSGGVDLKVGATGGSMEVTF